MNSISQNLANIRRSMPQKGVKLVCVSKFHTVDTILEAYEAGERTFGESRVQELCEKFEQMPRDIEWHFIGHLQTNKVKFIIPFVSLIHGVDSLRLLRAINKAAMTEGRTVRCLLQVHIAQEQTKFGFSPDELIETLTTLDPSETSHIQLCGLMGMATFTDDEQQIAHEFNTLRTTFDRVKAEFYATDEHFSELSMGMSDDYHIAIECGSTMIRVGSSIFGSRA